LPQLSPIDSLKQGNSNNKRLDKKVNDRVILFVAAEGDN
jgi:hypothetical protein